MNTILFACLWLDSQIHWRDIINSTLLMTNIMLIMLLIISCYEGDCFTSMYTVNDSIAIFCFNNLKNYINAIV